MRLDRDEIRGKCDWNKISTKYNLSATSLAQRQSNRGTYNSSNAEYELFNWSGHYASTNTLVVLKPNLIIIWYDIC